MKKIILTYFLIFAVFVSCKSGFSQDFFEKIFRTDEINIFQICENSPSVLSEGKFMEVYTMENVNVQVVIRNILDENKKPETDYRYSNGSWLKTPASDEIKAFVKKQLYQENPICYNENQLLKLLSENNNYFILIKQKIGPSILLLWDVKSERLYMLSSEDL